MANLGGSGGIYGTNPSRSIYPGDLALLMGTAVIPGFFGTSASGGPGGTNEPQTLAASQASSPVVIAAAPDGHPVTQRQLVWRVFPTGTANLALQVSTDDVGANYVTIDSVSTSSGAVRVITADNSSSNPPGAQATNKNLSSARFIRVKENSGSGSAVAIVDVTAL